MNLTIYILKTVKSRVAKVVLVKMGISSINGRLVSSLTGITGTATSRVSANTTASNNSDAVKNIAKLKDTSDTFARAASRLGSAAGYLQISKDILSKLVDVVDKSITLTQKAGKGTTSESSRRSLDREFKKLNDEFDKLRDKAKIEGIDLLSTDGIEYVLDLAGLSRDKASDIARLFRDFALAGDNSSLVDPKLKGSKKAAPNPSQPPDPSEEFIRRKISRNTTGADPYQVFATETGAVFQDDNDPTFNNADSVPTAIFVDELRSSQAVPNIIGTMEVLGVSEVSGYAIAQSTDDIFGYNPAGAMQLYLLAKDGAPIMQLSNFEQDFSVESADISSDGLKFAFATAGDVIGTNPDMSEDVYIGVLSELIQSGVGSPDYVAITDLIAGGNIQSGVKISESGRYVAYDGRGKLGATNNQLSGYHIFDFEKGSLDTTAGKSGRKVIGFFGAESLATYSSASKQLYSHDVTTGITDIEFETAASSLHAVSESGGLVYLDEENDIRYADLNQDTTTDPALVYDSASSDTFYQLSISSTSKGNTRVVAGGSISSDDSVAQAYMFETYVQNVKAQSKKADVVSSVFQYSLRNQANAQRATEDLKAISKQLKTNLKALDDGLLAVKSNLDLSLAMSESLYLVSGDNTAITSAEKIAASVQRVIAQYKLSAEALNQVDNLDEIKAAAVLS